MRRGECERHRRRGNGASGASNVTVTPLEPANHKLVNVTISVTAADETDPAPLVRIYDATANEAIDAPGSWDTELDWRITGMLTVDLRAERNGQGQDRIYTVWVEAVDAAGNRAVTNVTIRVPKEGGQSAPVQSQPVKRRRAGPK